MLAEIMDGRDVCLLWRDFEWCSSPQPPAVTKKERSSPKSSWSVIGRSNWTIVQEPTQGMTRNFGSETVLTTPPMPTAQ